MKQDFWHNAWESGKTGWKQRRANTRLVKYWPSLGLQPGAAVLVPLCGDSIDLLWLAKQDVRVVGAELSETAVAHFFSSNELDCSVSQLDGFKRFQSGNITIYCGDYFALTKSVVGIPLLGAYDRAALVAMSPDMRAAYVQQTAMLLEPQAKILLISMSYDQSKMKGPPFSVFDTDVDTLYSGSFKQQKLGEESGAEILGNLADRGLDTLQESVFMMSRQ